MIDYDSRTTNLEDYGDRRSYDDIIDDIVDKLMYDALWDIEKGMQDEYVKSRKDIDVEGMYEYVYEAFEVYVSYSIKECFIKKLKEELGDEW